MLEVALNLGGGKRDHRLSQTCALPQAGEVGQRQAIGKGWLSHQYDAGAGTVAAVRSCQCLEFNKCIIADAFGILDDNESACPADRPVVQQSLECSEALDRTVRLAADIEFRQQQFQHLVRCKLHPANARDGSFGGDGFERAIDDSGLADTDNPGDADHRIRGRERFLQARHDLDLGGPDKNAGRFMAGAEGSRLQTEMFVVHGSPVNKFPAATAIKTIGRYGSLPLIALNCRELCHRK